jgi:hypothetical protein
VTGRNPTGEIVSGSIFDKGLQFFMTTVASSFKIIYANFGIILLVVALLGLYYSFRKNWKFSLCSLLAIIFSLLIIALYSYGALENFLIDTILIITFYIAMGLLFIFETTNCSLWRIKSNAHPPIRGYINNLSFIHCKIHTFYLVKLLGILVLNVPTINRGPKLEIVIVVY